MPPFEDLRTAPILVTTGVVAVLGTWLLIPALMPLLRRYALARPNARSITPEPAAESAAVCSVRLLVCHDVTSTPSPAKPTTSGVATAVTTATAPRRLRVTRPRSLRR